MVVMKHGSITPFTLLVSQALTDSFCFVASNQPEYVYSLKKVLKTPEHVRNRIMIQYMVNTHTCLRTFLDMCTKNSFSFGIHVMKAFGRVTTQNTAVLTDYNKNDDIMKRFHVEFV